MWLLDYAQGKSERGSRMEETTTTTNNDVGVQSETASLVERTDALLKRIEEANRRSEETLKKNEEVLSRILLSGRSNAGTTAPVVDKEQAEKDRLNRILAPTGMKI